MFSGRGSPYAPTWVCRATSRLEAAVPGRGRPRHRQCRVGGAHASTASLQACLATAKSAPPPPAPSEDIKAAPFASPRSIWRPPRPRTCRRGRPRTTSPPPARTGRARTRRRPWRPPRPRTGRPGSRGSPTRWRSRPRRRRPLASSGRPRSMFDFARHLFFSVESKRVPDEADRSNTTCKT